MYIKTDEDGRVLCTKSDNGTVITFLSDTAHAPFDDAIPWTQTDTDYVRVGDAFVKTNGAEYLDTLKTEKCEELAASFDDRVAGSFTTSQGYLMQFDTSDSLKMQGAIQLLEATGQSEGYLTQADDTTVYHVPLDTMKAVLVEMLAAYAQCHARKQEVRALINSAQTAEDLDEIVISWPV